MNNAINAEQIEAALCEEWVRECDSRGLPMWSADEVLYELEPTDPNYAYVSDFILRWEQSQQV